MPLTDTRSALHCADAPDWPEAFAQRYRAAGYWLPHTFTQAFEVAASTHATSTALIQGARRASYADLLQRSRSLAGGLAAQGIGHGDAVVLHMPNGIEWVVSLLALMRLGARAILALPAHGLHEIQGFCDFAQARGYLGGADTAALADALRAQCPHLRLIAVDGDACGFVPLATLEQAAPLNQDLAHPEDIACFQLSGGTTGVPKLIPRRHCEYLYNLRASAQVCGLHARSVYLAALPMAHNFTLCCPGVLGTLMHGGQVVSTQVANPETCFRLIQEHGVTLTALVPPLAMLWLDARPRHTVDLSSLRLLQVGGARLLDSAAGRVRPVLGCQLQQVLGMAEGLLCFTRLDDGDERVLHTQGRPLSADDEIRIVDERGQPVPPGQPGELQVRGPYTIRGYYRLPEHNARAFTDDGFYCSGDLVRQTADGYLIVEGRDKDQINRGGEKIVAEEIEDLLIDHPCVLDAALVGIPDAYLGEATCAFVRLRAPAPSAFALKQYLRERGVASFKVPDRIEPLSEFPQTGVGKISKQQLRQQLRQAWQAQQPAGHQA
ncbi:(2,3-dihydroxybenzoyl)adenylate synthase [Pseudomonas putida]